MNKTHLSNRSINCSDKQNLCIARTSAIPLAQGGWWAEQLLGRNPLYKGQWMSSWGLAGSTWPSTWWPSQWAHVWWKRSDMEHKDTIRRYATISPKKLESIAKALPLMPEQNPNMTSEEWGRTQRRCAIGSQENYSHGQKFNVGHSDKWFDLFTIIPSSTSEAAPLFSKPRKPSLLPSLE